MTLRTENGEKVYQRVRSMLFEYEYKKEGSSSEWKVKLFLAKHLKTIALSLTSYIQERLTSMDDPDDEEDGTRTD